ncbi:transport integral membrane protein [marine actinobacterium PHSC20C1]|nr:transport integral membrane protein [marine actinobacterium PHSC20C1]
MRRIIRIGAALSAATIAALVLLVAAPAYAHNYLVASTPEEGAILTQLPEEFSVSTSDTLLDLAGDGGGFAIQVVDASGNYFGDGCFTIRDDSLSTTAALGNAGEYTMLWQLVSSDGHTISGEIGFEWQPDADQPISEGFDAPPACGGGTLEQTDPDDQATSTGDGQTDAATTVDAATVLLVAGAIALVLIAGVAIFLITVRRNRSDQ